MRNGDNYNRRISRARSRKSELEDEQLLLFGWAS